MQIISRAPLSRGTRVIINIGLTDILNGMSGEELNESFGKLMELCWERELKPIIFFIDPYNITNENDCWEKMNSFNDHLADCYNAHPLRGWNSDKLRESLCDILPR